LKYLEKWPFVTALIISGLVAVALKCQLAAISTPDFTKITEVSERKSRFLSYMYQQVKEVNEVVYWERVKLLKLANKSSLDFSERLFVRNLAHEYNLSKSLKTTADLKAVMALLVIRVDQIPPALILAQAANESAWGTSRFARQANNYFGIWCFSKGCGLVPKKRSSGKIHEVRYFNSAKDSVTYYVKLINSHRTYRELREIRASTPATAMKNSANKLATALGGYSERGEDYIKDLLALIRFNKLNEKYPFSSLSELTP